MKNILPFFLLLISMQLSAQNIGIGTSTPAARLHVVDSAVLFQGPATVSLSTPFAPPASGPGVRLMWYPQKAALRAGYATGSEWDKDSVGVFSVAVGQNVKAKGSISTSMGWSTTASGTASTSMGWSTTASAFYSTAMGQATTARGDASTSMGNGTVASGGISTSMGAFTTASGAYSTSMGNSTVASGYISTSMGYGTVASAFYSTSMGGFTTASADYSTSMGAFTRASGITSMAIGSYNVARSNNTLVIGTFNDTSLTNSLFEIGNGTADNARRNALTVLANGNTGIGISTPSNPLSFPPTLEKKISFYPGATGDVGISVSGNDLRIYSDNVNARVSFGYDSYATGFVSRAFVPASGTNALVVQGNLLVNSTTYSSDARFKQNIRPIAGSLEKILALQGVQYEMRVNEFPGRNFQPGSEIGLIAQEVEKVIPELVSTDTEGYKSVDYAKLVPVLLEGIKTQQQQLQQQQDLIQSLLKRVEALEKK